MDQSPDPVSIDHDLVGGDVDGALTVSWTHRLRVTRDAFAQDNPVIDSVLPEDADLRVLTVIDGGLHAARPGLMSAIEAWGRRRASRLTLAGDPIILPGGERAKSGWSTFETTAEAIARRGICRRSIVMMLGGGAVLDAAGFAAAAAHRGVRVIRFPSTTLAQGDAGIGVKNAINGFGMKNFLGTFSPPLAVINDVRFLDSLDPVHWRGGLSEAVKVAALKSASLLAMIERNQVALRTCDAPGLAAMAPVIVASARLHMDHILTGGDPFELNHARPLDLGHWAAHRLEALTGWSLPHGDAVAIGLAIDLLYAAKIGALAPEVARRLVDCLVNLGFPLTCEPLQDSASLLAGIEEFREHLGGRLAIPIVTGLECPGEVHEIEMAAMESAIDDVRRGFPPPR